jgi:hypothetical protein
MRNIYGVDLLIHEGEVGSNDENVKRNEVP